MVKDYIDFYLQYLNCFFWKDTIDLVFIDLATILILVDVTEVDFMSRDFIM